MKKWQKRLLIILAAFVVLIAGGLGYLKTQMYAPNRAATTAAKASVTTDYGMLFKAKKAVGPTVIFYPGALVAPASYSVWAKEVAAAGYPVAIVQFPLNLAVLRGNQAAKVTTSAQGYVIGGHSLGGVMASRYAAAHASSKLRGVYFMASYPDKKGALRKTDLPVLSLTASRDGVLEWDKWREAKQYLPASAQFAQFAGGNHAGFGSYGAQKGDKKATTSNAAQQHWVATRMIRWLRQLK